MDENLRFEPLAIQGGPKAKLTPNIPMYPGGLEIGEEEKKQVIEVLDRKYLFRYYGPEEFPSKVNELEKKYASQFGAKHALATTSCTGALISALVACGVGPGNEVIVNGYTFFASCAAIVGAKAIPVICEADDTLTMDPVDLENKINPSTKAVNRIWGQFLVLDTIGHNQELTPFRNERTGNETRLLSRVVRVGDSADP